jgi:hypothetical protein
MIAYNKTWLDNLVVRAACHKAFSLQELEEQEWKNIQDAHPVGFYTPNIFIRCGLFLLTLIIALFTFGLILLVFIDGIESAVEGLSIFFGLIAYAALELMAQRKHHLRSGVTEALIWTSAGCLFGGFSNLLQLSDLANCVLLFLLSTWFSLRFADIVSSLISFLSLLATLLYASIHAGDIMRSLAPFFLMAVSLVIYLFNRQSSFKEKFKHYRHGREAVEFCSLLTLYAAGNFFVIAQLNSKLLANGAPVNHIPFAWIFWIFTCAIPPAYIIMGLVKKDRMLYRVGLLLLVAVVFTVKYYFSVASIEVTLTIAGVLLIAAAWVLIRLLKENRYGFTYIKHEDEHIMVTNIETIVIAETFSQTPGDDNSTKFGGGSFGGAGAGGDY